MLYTRTDHRMLYRFHHDGERRDFPTVEAV